MNRCAGPRPRCGISHQSRPHRVQLRITQRFPQVWLIQRTRIEPSLPEVAAGAMPSIPIGGIPAVRMLQGLRQSICLVGNHNEMDMIGNRAGTKPSGDKPSGQTERGQTKRTPSRTRRSATLTSLGYFSSVPLGRSWRASRLCSWTSGQSAWA